MSVSSHLTPEPERRLWTILESVEHAAEWTDKKIAALTAFAAAELIFIKLLAPATPMGYLGLVFLSAALPLGVFAFSPLTGAPQRLTVLEPLRKKHSIDDCLLVPDDIANYAHGELIQLLDKYLGGGITSTRYYEDIIGQIVVHARISKRKQRLFRTACIVVGIGQIGLLGRLIGL